MEGSGPYSPDALVSNISDHSYLTTLLHITTSISSTTAGDIEDELLEHALISNILELLGDAQEVVRKPGM